DLALSLTEGAEGIAGRLSWRSDLFDRATAARLAGQLATLLAGIAADAGRPLSALPLLDEAARHQVLREWADAPASRSGRPVHERVAEWAERTPGAPAVAGEGRALTYGELARRAAGLARHLRRLGVGPDVPVGICLERSPDLLVAVLAVHAAGGAYVPLDPAHPAERLAWSLADSGAPLVLTREAFAARLGGTPVFLEALGDLAELPGPGPSGPVPPESLAYILYTSGSTGRPKGVGVEHRHLVSYVEAVLERLDPPAGAVFASVSTFAADLGNTAVFPALATGGCLLLAPLEAAQDPAALAEEFARWPPDYLKIVPSHLAALLADEDPARLLPRRGLVLGGEAASWDFIARLRALAPDLGLLNHYGPTETTVGVATWRIAGPESARGVSVPLGRPLAGATLHVLGPDLEPLPPGVPGELFIGGASVARGYVGRPDATAERFLPDPFVPGARLYRTGDLARLRPDGAVEFLGRMDHQVKIRGFRIEPAEVEAALAAHPRIREAAAGVVGQGEDRRLAAWAVAEGAPPSKAELLAFLTERLPGPMVPGEIHFLESLPLTLNGKLDRAALVALAPEPGRAEEGDAPRGAVEELMASLWCDLLGRSRVGRGDGFFELGGHSLLATRLTARLRAAFRVELPVRTVFEAPTLAGLARRVEEALAAGGVPGPPPVEPAPRSGPLPLSFSQERLWFLERLAPAAAAYNLAYHARVAGPLDVVALESAFRAVVRRHEVLRSAFTVADGAPVQIPLEEAAPCLRVIDLSALPPEVREGEALALAAAEARRPFALDRPPLLRAALVRLDAGENLLLATLHHIVSDAWSRGVLLGELAGFYEGRVPPPLAVQYGDFAVWQRRWLAGERLAGQLGYWQERLAGAPPLLDLPIDRPRAA
ncbi:MAG TPA: amino acid adenylation domain-containing protein, partial [Thermoanaerobaculia bacterium]|nr:amino acid adenylation domain-containing protein [Thermoanaerobaculia bacterium]